MCGIVGYIGSKSVNDTLINGLKRLEYRGYDSSGVAVIDGKEKLSVFKRQGKIAELEEALPRKLVMGCGIGHTRWATHGVPSTANAHPHLDCTGQLSLVHNGIIENYSVLKEKLTESGHKFKSETDTEVLAHLIEEHLDGNLIDAVRAALRLIDGTYGLALIHSRYPDKIIAARRGSPLLIGKGKGEMFVASDASAVIDHTRDVIYLEDNDLAEISRDFIKVSDLSAKKKVNHVERISWDISSIEKAGHEHFLIKEIMEQPESLKNGIRGRLNSRTGDTHFGGLNMSDSELTKIDSIILTGMGTAYNAAMLGEYMIENIAGVASEVEPAAEFRYKNPVVRKNTLGIAISQSGETADTLAAVEEMRKKGAKTLGLINVVGSTIAREVDGGIYIHAGPEISVASTKAFTSQVLTLAMFTLHLARLNGAGEKRGKEIIKEISSLPDKVSEVLSLTSEIKKLAKRYAQFDNFLYLGRNYQYPVALEGALKLKEISYIHAEGYSAAEMKHGPIALIDENFVSVFLAPHDSMFNKTLSNMEEVRARRGPILAVTTNGAGADKLADDVIRVPEAPDWLLPIITSVPLQLLAYYIALERGTDVDQPRNLAKSVTVE